LDPATRRYTPFMAGCCPSRDYHRLFNQRFARRLASRYGKRGLDATARKVVEFLRQLGTEGASVLEIGGGVGEIEIELLKAGAARAQNLELSPAYKHEAHQLVRQAGVQGRLDWRIHDLAQRTPGRWRRPTWWSCTGWCAATPTTSACLQRPPTMPGGP
jgi:hypothetical protein